NRARVLFGHSMGAIVGFELAHRLQRRGAPVRGLIVSGCRAPAVEQRDFRSDQPDHVLVERLRAQGGTPDELLDHPEFAALFLPVLRADLRALEAYRKPPRPPLDCPIRAFAGELDPEATPDSVADWSRETCASFRLERFPGGHFFPLQSQPAVFEALRSAIESFAGGSLPR
ncbi:MAG: thioesterase, partial [Acidobacteria bacterium]|nr:thioesterase [Acidobacteriota bacterium]